MPISLVTGGTGFIGSHLVAALLDRGHQVRVLFKPPANLDWLPRERITLYPVEPGIPFDFSPVLQGVDIVFHMAGLTKAKTLDEYMETNAGLTRQVLEAISRYAPGLKRLVVTSSQAAAGPAAGGAVKDETMECRPVTFYGQSKLAAEQVLAEYPEIPTVVLRPSSVYGPRDRDVLLLVKTVQGGVAPIIGSPDRRLTWVHVADIVQAQILAAESPSAVGQIYFVSDGRIYTWRDTQAAIEKALGRKALGIQIPLPVVYTLAAISDGWARLTRTLTIFNLNKCKEIAEQNWACSSEKIQRELGYQPRYNLEEGIQETIAWARANGWL